MSFEYSDSREFIARIGELGGLRHIDGADPEGEIGGVTENAAGLPECPALLFARSRAIRAASASSPMRP